VVAVKDFFLCEQLAKKSHGYYFLSFWKSLVFQVQHD